MSPRMMNIDEVAAYLNLSRETLYKYVQKSMIPAVKIGRHWRFDKDQLDAWFRESNKPVATEQPRAPTGTLSILIVEDDPLIRKLLSAWATDADCSVQCAENGRQALDLLQSRHFDLLFLDLNLPDMTGAEVLDRAGVDKAIPTVIITGDPDSPIMDQAIKHNVTYALAKPFRHEEVTRILDFARSHSRN